MNEWGDVIQDCGCYVTSSFSILTLRLISLRWCDHDWVIEVILYCKISEEAAASIFNVRVKLSGYIIRDVRKESMDGAMHELRRTRGSWKGLRANIFRMVTLCNTVYFPSRFTLLPGRRRLQVALKHWQHRHYHKVLRSKNRFTVTLKPIWKPKISNHLGNYIKRDGRDGVYSNYEDNERYCMCIYHSG